jgi:hypothetical protein
MKWNCLKSLFAPKNVGHIAKGLTTELPVR